MDEDYWKSTLREDSTNPQGVICRYCGQGNATEKSRQAHEEYHVLEYMCQECPDRAWQRRANAKGHNGTHHIVKRYHAPRRLIRGPKLYPRWTQPLSEPMVMIRRLTTLPHAAPTPPPPEPKLPAIDPTVQGSNEGELDLLEQILFEMGDTEVDWSAIVTAELGDMEVWPQPSPLPVANQTEATTSQENIQMRVKAARRDVENAKELLTSAETHLANIEACLAMRDATDPWMENDTSGR